MAKGIFMQYDKPRKEKEVVFVKMYEPVKIQSQHLSAVEMMKSATGKLPTYSDKDVEVPQVQNPAPQAQASEAKPNPEAGQAPKGT